MKKTQLIHFFKLQARILFSNLSYYAVFAFLKPEKKLEQLFFFIRNCKSQKSFIVTLLDFVNQKVHHARGR